MAVQQQSLSKSTSVDLPTIKLSIPTLTIIEDFDKLIAKEVIFDETGIFLFFAPHLYSLLINLTLQVGNRI
jgi:hypothetical protein